MVRPSAKTVLSNKLFVHLHTRAKYWVEYLPMVELVVNSAVAESNGMALAYVKSGQRLRMPVDCLNDVHPVQAA